MAYDRGRQRTLLFGGEGSSGVVGDTWTWDGDRWVQVDEIGPSPRGDHAMAYDEKRDVIVLFGGGEATGPTGDTWGWDGSTWTQLSDFGPRPRSGHAMAFDATREQLLFFGGRDEHEHLQDTWSWDGTDWTQLQDIGPSPRAGHAISFDSATNRLVLFGGDRDGTTDGTTWEWDGEHWVEVARFGPAPRTAAAMCALGDTTMLFGGSDSQDPHAPFADTWEWVDHRWTQRLDIGPSARFDHAAVLDTARGRTVLFGGIARDATGVEQLASDTWELAVATTTPTTGSPGADAFELSAQLIQLAAPNWRIAAQVTLHAPAQGAVHGTLTAVGGTGQPIGAPQNLHIPASGTVAAVTFDVPSRPVAAESALTINSQDYMRTVTF